MSETTQEPHSPRSIFNPGAPWLKAVTTIGLGAVIAMFFVKHYIDLDKRDREETLKAEADQREFLQEQLIKVLQQSAEASAADVAASQQVASAIQESNDVLENFAVQMDDLSDEQRQLNRWVETMMKARFQEHEEDP